MRRFALLGSLPAAAALVLLLAADPDRLWRLRNLGKAFYENPTTQAEAVEQFRQALALQPESARERVNYGLALLRAGKTKEGIAELERAQKQDPKIPHTWFNLGIAYKRDGQYERAAAQFGGMIRLVPDEPVSHYNLAVLLKLLGKPEEALRSFERARDLEPNLAGPHFQLYNAYRQARRAEEAARELKIFQEIKQRQTGAAVPEDMEWSFYAEIYETIDPRPATPSPAPPKFATRALAGRFRGIAILDADMDGTPDLLAWSPQEVRLFRGGVTAAPMPSMKDTVAIAPGDFDNDGWPDLAVLTAAGPALYRNVKGAFRPYAARLPEGRYDAAVWLDYDHDYDLDLLLLGQQSALARNQGEAGFTAQPFPFVKGQALAGTLFDLVPDTDGTDLVVTYRDRPGVLYRDKLAGNYQAVTLEALPAGAAAVAAYDLNYDGWTDIAIPGGVLFNRSGKLERAPAPAGLPAYADLHNRGALDAAPGLPADFNGDGRVDAAVLRADGALEIDINQSPPRHWTRITLAGVKNLKLAPGAEVEVKTGALYQKRTYHGLPLHFGLEGFTTIDTVRITWPNGLIQNEPRQPVNQPLAYKEAQRLSGSCPMIFTWNGHRFEFLTDVLGVAPLGVGGLAVDRDEYVQIPGSTPIDGQHEIRLTEELREVSYLDRIRLVAVEHDPEIEIVTSEKFKAPPFPEFRLYAVGERRYPIAARDHSGANVLDRLTSRDQTYPDSFRRDHAGVAEMHHLDLDFGGASPRRAVLVLHGWVDWADGSTFRNAEQAGKPLVFPYLQVKDARGRWQTVVADMGIPAGKPKTIAVEVPFLSASREVRIVTNLAVYWDEAFLTADLAPPNARWTPMAPLAAELRFRGFSTPQIHPERKQPEAFDYQRVLPVTMWNPTPGRYTRYGDVHPLLADADDNLLIMGSGDELKLRFPAPKPRPGKKISLLLHVEGWAKDADLNTAYSRTVLPLPFRDMPLYGAPAPAGELHRRYNTRPAARLIPPLR